ncbi:hypothetical protein ACS0TY_018405 [Phlomoides rotata]
MCSSSSKTRLFYLANSLLHSNPPYYRNNVACFTSTSNKIQDGINTPTNLREAGSEGIYDPSAGIPNVDNKTKLNRKGGEENYSIEDAAKAAVDTGLKVGEMAVDGVWDAAKKTAESMRPDDENGHVEDVTQHADKHVEDLRRRAGGYDLKN